MNSDHISSHFQDTGAVGTTTNTRAQLEENIKQEQNELADIITQHEIGITEIKQELAVASVRDLMAEYINKGDKIYTQKDGISPDLNDILNFVGEELEQAEFFVDTTRHKLSEQGLDMSELNVASTYKAAVKSVAEKYYSMLSHAPEYPANSVESIEQGFIEIT